MLVAAPSVGVVLGPWGPESQRAMEPTALEPEGEKPILRVPEPEAPENSLLEGAAPQHKYLQLAQLAGPWLEGE